LAVLAQLRNDLEKSLCHPVRKETQPKKRFSTLMQKIDELNTENQTNPFQLLSRLAQDSANQENQITEQVASITSWLLEFFEDCIRNAPINQTTTPKLNPQHIAEMLLAIIIGTACLNEITSQQTQPNHLPDLFKTLLEI